MAYKFALILLGVVMGIAPGLAEGTPGKAEPGSERAPLQTVSSVDINRYMGTWYEIARMPNRFEKKCKDDVTAHYELNADGKVSVRNECRMMMVGPIPHTDERMLWTGVEIPSYG